MKFKKKINNALQYNFKEFYQLHVNLGRVLSLILVNQILRLTKIKKIRLFLLQFKKKTVPYKLHLEFYHH